MPYESEKQRKFMYAKKPEIAKKYEAEGKNYIKGGKKMVHEGGVMRKEDEKKYAQAALRKTGGAAVRKSDVNKMMKQKIVGRDINAKKGY